MKTGGSKLVVNDTEHYGLRMVAINEITSVAGILLSKIFLADAAVYTARRNKTGIKNRFIHSLFHI